MNFLIILVIVVVTALVVLANIMTKDPRRSLAKESLIGNPEYRNAPKARQRAIEDEWFTNSRDRKEIFRAEIEPGDEISALDGHISWFDQCESEDEWQLNFKELPAFIQIAKERLKHQKEIGRPLGYVRPTQSPAKRRPNYSASPERCGR